MKILEVNFDDIQKAMEDVKRDRSEYYLDTQTGKVIMLPGGVIESALHHLYGVLPEDDGDEEVEFDSELNTAAELPDRLVDHLETTLDVLPDAARYVRIPERNSTEAFSCMKAFADGIAHQERKRSLLVSLQGAKAFRKFKNTLLPLPKEKKEWNRFNARKMQRIIRDWLHSLDILPVRKRKLSGRYEKT